ncbi:MAG: protein-L-isoaspartate(D-aspartate) O-methyltransferase [Gammaproteobacteria bacterium]|nr:protein-L-isoaspartate(D-aspartate) O-methyltransferase [Gammaproteobacteria bacterium]
MAVNGNRDRRGIGMTSLRTRRRLINRLRDQGITSEKVLGAMLETPRHLFIDEALAHKAYEDTALPIGHNQTISQPFIVALMTQMVMENRMPVKKVLEIGTGCGYQTAVLSLLVNWVFTIERISALQQATKNRLPGLGYRNVSYLNGDGFAGWESNQPFDGIVVTAAPETVPETLVNQLSVGGRLVVPVGGSKGQRLRVVTRTHWGYDEEQREAVRFVPMLNGRI